MRLDLKPHPLTPASAATRVAVEILRPAKTTIFVRYFVEGLPTDLELAPAATSHADSKSPHTWFGLSVWPPGSLGYYDFHLLPGRDDQWFDFKGSRDGLGMLGGGMLVPSEWRVDSDTCELRASLDLWMLLDLAPEEVWRVEVTATVALHTGALSYWAAHHPQPHQRPPPRERSDLFALELLSPAQP